MMETFELNYWSVALLAVLVLFTSTAMYLASRYKRCPSDMILVIFGKVGEGQSARCIHGGACLTRPA